MANENLNIFVEVGAKMGVNFILIKTLFSSCCLCFFGTIFVYHLLGLGVEFREWFISSAIYVVKVTG